MKKKILIVFFGLIFCLGVYFAFNREPKVDAGRITVTVNEKEKGISGCEVAVYRNSKLKETGADVVTDVKKLKDNIKSIDQIVAKNDSDEQIDIATDTRVNYYGRVYSASYSIYDLDGNVIEENLDMLKLPTKDINGCIVKVDVKWGRKSNYRQYVYFFKVNFIKQAS